MPAYYTHMQIQWMVEGETLRDEYITDSVIRLEHVIHLQPDKRKWKKKNTNLQVFQKIAAIIWSWTQSYLQIQILGTCVAEWSAVCQTAKLSFPASPVMKAQVAFNLLSVVIEQEKRSRYRLQIR